MENCGCQSPNSFVIFTGQAKTMNLKAAYSNGGDPLDLTSCSEIVVGLPNTDGTFTDLKLSLTQVSIVSPTNLGKITVPITSIVSALLNVGELQNVDVSYTISGLVTTVRFFQALTVVETAS